MLAAIAERRAHGELLFRHNDRIADADIKRQSERQRQRTFERLRVTNDAKEVRAIAFALRRFVAFDALFQQPLVQGCGQAVTLADGFK